MASWREVITARNVAEWEAAGATLVDEGEGHRKGWAWAQQFGIRDTDYANGNSASFNEGVRMYARSIGGGAGYASTTGHAGFWAGRGGGE